MTSAVGSGAVRNADEVERARKIEDSICSVITSVVSCRTNRPSEMQLRTENETPCSFPVSMIGRNAGEPLNHELFPTIIAKHKSLASSLPSLTGVMVDSSLLTLSSSTRSMNICAPTASTTTTTSTRSSRHLQLVGDLPENVLETSCTPPSSPSKLVGGQQHQQSAGAAPVFTSLVPVSMGLDSANSVTSVGAAIPMYEPVSSTMAEDRNHRPAAMTSSSGATFSSSCTAAALTQLFPMAAASGSALPQAYLAVKVEPQDIVYRSGSPTKDDGSSGCSATMLSPLQFSLATGSITSPTFTTFSAATSIRDGDSAVGSLSSAASGADILSLQPAALYVQPVQQNGQVQYVRVELPSTISLATAGTLASSATSTTVSTVELAHNIIATMFQQPAGSMSSAPGSYERGQMVNSVTVTPRLIVTDNLLNAKSDSCLAPFKVTAEPASAGATMQQRVIPAGITVTPTAVLEQLQQAPASVASRKKTASSASQSRPQRSTSREAGPGGSLSGDESDEIYIDTKELCNRIAYELKAHSIPQAVFAERVLCRSQGTLSDLLRNPKPWNKLKSGRETFRRMYVWLKQPLEERLASLELWKGGKRKASDDGDAAQADVQPTNEPSGDESIEEMSENVCYDAGGLLVSAPPDDPVASTSNEHLPGAPVESTQQSSPQRHQQRMVKKPRLVFTDIQKRTLQAIFKETQRPSREMQQTIAEHLNLDLSTVQNFFMNARRRSRIEQPEDADSPTPFQQVRPITPPPAGASSPPYGLSEAASGVPNILPTASLSPVGVFAKLKPKRANKRSSKQKQMRPTDANGPATTDDINSPSGLSFSGMAASVTDVRISSPQLATHHAGTVNGVEELLLGEQNGADEEGVYIGHEGDASSPDGGVNILQYGTYACPSGTDGQPVVIATTATLVDAKPQIFDFTERFACVPDATHCFNHARIFQPLRGLFVSFALLVQILLCLLGMS